MLIAIDGFENTWSDLSLADKWRGSVVGVNMTSTTPQNAGKSLQLQGSSDYARIVPNNIYELKNPNHPDGVIGFHIKLDQSIYGYSYPIVQICDPAGQPHMGLSFSKEGRILWERGTTPIYQSKGYRYNGSYSSDGQWVYIEIDYQIANSISSNSCRIIIDGSTVLNLPAGTQTLNTSISSLVYCVQFKASPYSRLVDNFYWANNTGVGVGYPLNNGGGIYVITMPPSADGDIEWVGYPWEQHDFDYEYVDDIIPDDDATYLATFTTDNLNSFSYGKPQQFDGFPWDFETQGTIYGVQLCSRCISAATDSEAHMYHHVWNGIDFKLEPSDTGHLNNSYYRYYISIINVYPTTSSSWSYITRNQLNALFMGVGRGDYIP